MECDVFYSKNPPYEGEGDRCARNEIAAGVAIQFSILGIGTVFFGKYSARSFTKAPAEFQLVTKTFSGVWNLFVTGSLVKRWGPRAALVLQTSLAGVRVAWQVVGVHIGGQAGIWIVQSSQAITVLGGPAGYM
jgi:hypothetical protein